MTTSAENPDTKAPWKSVWSPSVFYRPEKETFNFAGYEICIYESVGSYGSMIWPGAVALCTYLDTPAGRQQVNLLEKSAIEIGAGTGLLAIVATLLGAKVTATDLPEVLGNLRFNLSRNTKQHCRHPAQVAALSWGVDLENSFPRSTHQYDFVLAADVVYHHDYLNELLVTMRHFCQAGTTLVWSNKIRFKTDLTFIERFKEAFHATLLAENDEIRIYMATAREAQADSGQTMQTVGQEEEKEQTVKEEIDVCPVEDVSTHTEIEALEEEKRHRCSEIEAFEEEKTQGCSEIEALEEEKRQRCSEIEAFEEEKRQRCSEIEAFEEEKMQRCSEIEAVEEEKRQRCSDDEVEGRVQQDRNAENKHADKNIHENAERRGSEKTKIDESDGQQGDVLGTEGYCTPEVSYDGNHDLKETVCGDKDSDKREERPSGDEGDRNSSAQQVEEENILTTSENADTKTASNSVWSPSVFYRPEKETFNFAGYEICIYESVGSYGSMIWPGAVALCRYLDTAAGQQQVNLLDKSAIEIGAGTGLLSIVATLLGAKVTATDLPEVLGNLRFNLSRNTKQHCRHPAQVAALSWGVDLENSFPRSTHQYDFVLAADVVYHHDHLNELLVTMRHFCQAGTTLVWSNKIRFETDLTFIERFKEAFHTTLLAENDEIRIYMATAREAEADSGQTTQAVEQEEEKEQTVKEEIDVCPVEDVSTHTEIEALEEEKTQRCSEIEALKEEKRQRCSEIEAVEEEKRQRCSEIEALEEEKGQRCSEIEALEEEKTQRCSEIEALEEEKRQRCSEIEAFEEEKRQRCSEIEALEEEKTQRCSEIEAFEEEKTQRCSEIEALEEEKTQRCSEIEALEEEKRQRCSEIEAFEDEKRQRCSDDEVEGREQDINEENKHADKNINENGERRGSEKTKIDESDGQKVDVLGTEGYCTPEVSYDGNHDLKETVCGDKDSDKREERPSGDEGDRNSSAQQEEEKSILTTSENADTKTASNSVWSPSVFYRPEKDRNSTAQQEEDKDINANISSGLREGEHHLEKDDKKYENKVDTSPIPYCRTSEKSGLNCKYFRLLWL
ncbi:uncharacterized protein LOC134071723 [Sardina pilchardus]|uniref:uncharacterized protein LOC134071723 n=1 Tax=Sardina pilchardus TaxID=27697 RepID=UPI002E0E84FB